MAVDNEPTDEQVAAVKVERMQSAIQPFRVLDLRETVITVQRTLEQVIDEVTQDVLLSAGYEYDCQEGSGSVAFHQLSGVRRRT